MVSIIDRLADRLIAALFPPVPEGTGYCPKCGGSGQGKYWDPCPHCNGGGRVKVKRCS